MLISRSQVSLNNMENTPTMLRNFSSLFKTLINNSYQKNELEGFALVSSFGKIISTNEILRAITGYSEKDLESLLAPEFFSGNLDELMQIVHAAKEGKIEWENQLVKTKSGGFIPVDISAVTSNKAQVYLVCSFALKNIGFKTQIQIQKEANKNCSITY